MKKTVYLLNIGDYAPELTALTYPTIYAYAERIGAEVYVINRRRFHEWPVTYEKLQIHELAKRREDDWAIYIDSDVLIHPDLPDVTELMPRDHVCHNALDWAPIRWTYDEYFRRDGRGIGSANWFACASSWCLDLWRPIDDLTPEEAEQRIHLVKPETDWMKPEHLIDDYALSRNIARFGLKVTTLNRLWNDGGIYRPPSTEINEKGELVNTPPYPEFFWHEYLMSVDEKIEKVKDAIGRWGL